MRREQRPNQNSFKLNSNLLPIKEKKNPKHKKITIQKGKNQHIPIESTKGLETLDWHSNQLPSNPLKLKPAEILLKKKKNLLKLKPASEALRNYPLKFEEN